METEAAPAAEAGTGPDAPAEADRAAQARPDDDRAAAEGGEAMGAGRETPRRRQLQVVVGRAGEVQQGASEGEGPAHRHDEAGQGRLEAEAVDGEVCPAETGRRADVAAPASPAAGSQCRRGEAVGAGRKAPGGGQLQVVVRGAGEIQQAVPKGEGRTDHHHETGEVGLEACRREDRAVRPAAGCARRFRRPRRPVRRRSARSRRPRSRRKPRSTRRTGRRPGRSRAATKAASTPTSSGSIGM